MMSFKLSIRCHRCIELGFHPAQNWHPMAAARQTHILKHLRHDFDALEKEQDAQLLQNDWFEPIRDICFPQQNQAETGVICDNCGKGFGLKRGVEKHLLLVHLKQKPFKCPQCSESFGQKVHLNQHQASVHENLKPFSCKVCGHAFSQKGNLKKHQEAVHGKQKPFMCHHCGKRFGWKHVLKDHERTHTGEKPFQCENCSKCFSQSSHKSQHVKSVHKKW